MDSATNLGSLRASFFAGSFAGACGILIGHPFDSLKVRMQVNAQLAKQGITTEVAKQLYRNCATFSDSWGYAVPSVPKL